MLRYEHYIADLNKVTSLLKERERQGFDDRHVDYLLVEAVEISCKTLNNILIEDSFWSWIEENEQNLPTVESSADDFEEIILPVNSQLLKELKYIGPPSAEDLIIDAKNAIEQVKYGKGVVLDVRTKIENLASFICSNAGKARGVLGAYEAGVYSKPEEKKEERGLFLKLQKKIPVKKIITGIKDAITIITGVITIAGHIHGKQLASSSLPPEETKIERGIESVQSPSPERTIFIDDFWWKYYNGLGNNPEKYFPKEDKNSEF